jgi:hypothetical protein
MCLFEVHFVAAADDLADAYLPFMWSLSEQEVFQTSLDFMWGQENKSLASGWELSKVSVD